MPYSLYIDSDSACCMFHPLWHCHSCLCCRDVVAIELLWLRDSLIVRGWAGVVKSIQCSEWFLPHTRQCWKLLSLWNQIGRASECERLVDRMIGKRGYCTRNDGILRNWIQKKIPPIILSHSDALPIWFHNVNNFQQCLVWGKNHSEHLIDLTTPTHPRTIRESLCWNSQGLVCM